MGIRERRTRITRGILAGLGAAVLLVVGTVTTVKAAPAAAEAAAFTVYMAPAGAGGSDANDGLSSGKAVATLPRVQQVLQQQKPTTDVEVRIKQGTYIVNLTADPTIMGETSSD